MTAIRRSIAIMLLSVAGCGDADGSTPSVFPTEHLEVDPSDSDVVCRGLLDDMEVQAVRVAEWLELGLPSIIRIGYGATAVEELCGTGTHDYGGCVRGFHDETKVAGDYTSIYHELVHAVRATNGLYSSWFFEEGIAEVLEGFRPHAHSVELDPETLERGPVLLAGLPRAEIRPTDYGIAGVFTQWLIDTYGREAVVAFLNDEALIIEDAGVAFAEHFGLTLQEAEDAWRDTAEDFYLFGENCYPERALDWSGPALTLAGRVDCAAPNTSGPSGGNISTLGHCFTLEEPAVLRVEFDAPVGKVTIDSAEVLCSGPNVDLTPEHYQRKTIQAGEALDLPFAACSWEIRVSTTLDQPTDFTLRLTRP